MNCDWLPQKRQVSGNELYELIVPNGAQSSYLELLSKLKFTEELIEYTEQFSANSHKVQKKDDFEIRYWKALLGLKAYDDPEMHIRTHRNLEEVFIKRGNRLLTYGKIQDFVTRKSTCSDLIQVYIEFLKPISRVLVVNWEGMLQMIQEDNIFDVYLGVLVYVEHKNSVFIINRSEKVVTSIVKPSEVVSKELEMVIETFSCKKFSKITKERNWTNEELLAIIRKFYFSGAVDDEIEVPENFQTLILHDISTI